VVLNFLKNGSFVKSQASERMKNRAPQGEINNMFLAIGYDFGSQIIRKLLSVVPNLWLFFANASNIPATSHKDDIKTNVKISQ